MDLVTKLSLGLEDGCRSQLSIIVTFHILAVGLVVGFVRNQNIGVETQEEKRLGGENDRLG